MIAALPRLLVYEIGFLLVGVPASVFALTGRADRARRTDSAGIAFRPARSATMLLIVVLASGRSRHARSRPRGRAPRSTLQSSITSVAPPARGSAPYIGVWDHKPPGMYLASAAAQAMLGWLGPWTADWLLSLASTAGIGVGIAAVLGRLGVGGLGSAGRRGRGGSAVEPLPPRAGRRAHRAACDGPRRRLPGACPAIAGPCRPDHRGRVGRSLPARVAAGAARRGARPGGRRPHAARPIARGGGGFARLRAPRSRSRQRSRGCR